MIAYRIKARGPEHAAGPAKHTAHTRLVWHRERLAALLGFAIGVMAMLLVVLFFDALPAQAPCTYSPPELPVQGCTFEWR